jgi:hypothetical protein
MRSKPIMALSLLCVPGMLTTACGSGDDTNPAKAVAVQPSVLPQRLDRPDLDAKLEPKAPADDASLAENLSYELRKKTLAMAQAPGDTTAHCPKQISPKPGTTVTCTTTYAGLTVTWKVTLGGTADWSVGDYVTFKATPDQAVLTKIGVARTLWGNHRDTIDYAMCNNVPEAVLVPLNEKTKYNCEVVDKGKQPTGYGSAVRVTESGPRVY